MPFAQNLKIKLNKPTNNKNNRFGSGSGGSALTGIGTCQFPVIVYVLPAVTLTSCTPKNTYYISAIHGG